jgi:RimJ/RimL family protein N-acetyltransferase
MVKKTGFLKGKSIYLRPLLEEDAEGEYLHWFNDDEVCRGNSHHVIPYTKEKILGYIRHARESTDEFILAIALNENGKHIGNIAFQEINHIYRSADLTIIIGDKSAWGKGYGFDAAGLLLRHGFNTMNLHRISCATFDTNPAMKKLALSLGMKEEGRRIEAAYKDGNYVDIIEYGILKSDFEYKKR